MNRKHKAKKRKVMIRAWTLDQARQALPYLSSVMQTLRETRLEAQQEHLRAERLAARPGRPDRDALLAREAALQESRRAEERFQEALHELASLHVYCLDPVAGLALIPFAHDDQLAWFVFDLFDNEHINFWRLHDDPLETRRPIAEVQEGPAEGTVTV